ncbi:uncharacterized protein DUF1450 [Tumebacillus sp. BK434]|uniref:DUF1450 domain-containing protein n=1 Tax=Tumebacillus sp. BK434 TaxID=2512169 RepID=UPI0010E40674|nr:DUF1450 domain-containing protein [Tumebacillus sp. BK434]TCP59586.1 uncharacterized protein DUF1450 [Tumebacillus sp. BK434]
MVIEICETNESAKLIKQLRITFPDADVMVYSCLNRCAGCFLCYFAILDGVLIEAFSAEQLLHQIILGLQSAKGN